MSEHHVPLTIDKEGNVTSVGTAHTPMRLAIHTFDNRLELHPEDDEHGETVIADMVFGDTQSKEECEAYAALIVKAVNHHDELVAALKEALSVCRTFNDEIPFSSSFDESSEENRRLDTEICGSTILKGETILAKVRSC